MQGATLFGSVVDEKIKEVSSHSLDADVDNSVKSLMFYKYFCMLFSERTGT